MENEKTVRVLTRIKRQIETRDIADALNDLRRLYNGFEALIGQLVAQQVVLPQIWYEYYEAMGIKFRLNLGSIIDLYGSPVDQADELIHHDLGSVYLLNRSLLETYLTFYYCFIMPSSNEEGLMNYYIFKISGLMQRQGYGLNDPQGKTPERQALHDSEKLNIDKYRRILENMPCFLALDKKQQKDLLAGKYAKRFGFLELIRHSELKNILFEDMWKLYSNYAHSELLGLLQINSYADEPGSIYDALFSTLNNTLIVTSMMLKDFSKVFTETGHDQIDIPELDEELITLLQFWYGSGKNILDGP
ncbi:hypothetical protein ACFGVS_20410 [Mucilaginibacter sp. AW1-7]|uniref:hypothetical protein n=1 Tax=Mucilaginibacter sp. AW1-7 TaxID=3349874 RepID=UPI003F73FD78